MFKQSLTILTAAAILFTTAPASADWNTGDPYKWVQMPDLSPQGMDVNATFDQGDVGGLPPFIVLADDFLCTSTDPITDIHLWGSWKNDQLPQVFDPNTPGFFSPDPGAVMFNLSIHADIPANQNPAGYSMPGQLLWSKVFNPGEFAVRPWATNIEEGWLDPISGQYIFPGDTVAWQYNFLIPEVEAFIQQGTSTDPVVYWLDVAAVPQNEGVVTEEPLFGWKTSIDHFNDTAVYGSTDLFNWPNVTNWQPIDSPIGVSQLDMAFVITPEPATLVLFALGGLAMLRRRG